MAVQAYVNLPGTCREALALYAKVFGSPAPEVMTFGQMPPDPSFPVDARTKDLVMHAELEVDAGTLLLSDVPPGMPLTIGNNVSLMLQSKDAAAITRWYAALAEGGKVGMKLGPTFWSKLYGSVTDRFGVIWQFNLLE